MRSEQAIAYREAACKQRIAELEAEVERLQDNQEGRIRTCDRCGLPGKLLDLDTGSICHPEPIQCIQLLRARLREANQTIKQRSNETKKKKSQGTSASRKKEELQSQSDEEETNPKNSKTRRFVVQTFLSFFTAMAYMIAQNDSGTYCCFNSTEHLPADTVASSNASSATQIATESNTIESGVFLVYVEAATLGCVCIEDLDLRSVMFSHGYELPAKKPRGKGKTTMPYKLRS